MKKLCACLSFLIFTAPGTFAQGQPKPSNSSLTLGLGLGLDYGGIGIRPTYRIVPEAAVFLGFGYNFVGTGYNAGATWRILPEKRFTPAASIMYGYNAFIMIAGAEQYNKVYYGLSLAGGVEIKLASGANFNIELVFPMRSPAFKEDVRNIQKLVNVDLPNPLPVAFSFGYHFPLLP
jgi:hypothetical protein